MSRQSTPQLRTLHAVRLLGYANPYAIAERAGVDPDNALRALTEAEQAGWVQHVAFADLDGWSLTDDGKAENERQLAAERDEADAAGAIGDVYRTFLPLNARLVQAVTDWQIKPTTEEPLAPNDHTDPEHDADILEELATLDTALDPLNLRLTAVLTRFDGYASRFHIALQNAAAGHADWIDKTDIDSCHRVWFQLHEDLIATLGIDRHVRSTDGTR